MKKLAIITTHPIQYYAPVFKMLAMQIDVKVFYTAGAMRSTYDTGFKQDVVWDLPLLEGYNYEFLKNTAKDPGSHHFNGVMADNAISRIVDFGPDTLLIYGWAYKGHLKILRHFKNKVAIVFRGDSTLLDPSPFWKSTLKAILLKWVYSHVNHALYVGFHNQAYYKKHGLSELQLSFVPHAIDNERFATPREKEAQQLRKKLSIPNEDILVLFAGKFETKKDPLALLDAYVSLESTTIHLLFVGNGELESKLKSGVKESGLTTIYFLPFQNQQQMPVIYQACDLFCIPSKGPGETWGLAINEAMAAGKAILSSAMTGAAIDLVDSTNGGIFDNTADDLKSKLKQLTQSKTQLTKLGKASAIKIKDWNFEAQVRGIINYV